MSELKFCDSCNSPDPKHEGGGIVDGKEYSGIFCSRECFDRWLKWKGAIITFSAFTKVQE